MSTTLEQEIARFSIWKGELIEAIEDYRAWLESTAQLAIPQSARFYELTESLKAGRLMIAFIAEFSRGKTELINALFFSEYKQRLLPSDVGRTTMCPTEIFHDADQPPYVRLLPIETRYRDDSIAQLKNQPSEWTTIGLNLESVDEMRAALASLRASKEVFPLEAKMMGFIPEGEAEEPLVDSSTRIEIPAWRYALINFLHPLLKQGVSILDTPGLNALGLEPELTLSMLPSAHAALFLLGIDTGVTRSDLEVWQRYVKDTVKHRIAVLNKIDLTWDDLKPWEEIDASLERQKQDTARQLNLDPSNVITLSAQKALVGKVRGDADLVARSGIGALESMLAERIVPARREILRHAVVAELGAMMLSTEQSIRSRLAANQAASTELTELSGKSRDVVTRLWRKINQDKEEYNAALAEYKSVRNLFQIKRTALADRLNPARMQELLSRSREVIEGSWTTVGLHGAMTRLIESLTREFEQVQSMGEDMQVLMTRAHASFERKFGFIKADVPVVDLEAHYLRLRLLAKETESFCRDPVNVMTAKGPLVRKFYGSLVEQAQRLFGLARRDYDQWMRTVAHPLEGQLRDHKAQLQQRLDSLSEISSNAQSVQERLAGLKAEQVEILKQQDMIRRLILRVRVREPVPAVAAA